MAFYQDPNTKQVIDVTNEALNPDLIAGKTKVADAQGTAINSATLTPVTQPQVTPPAPAPLPNVGADTSTNTSSTTTPATPPPTPVTDSLHNMINEAIGLQNNVAGESAYRQQQLQQQGLTAVTDEQGNVTYQNKTLVDLQNQLKNLTAQSNQIPLQLQNQAQGRGMTAGGLAPIEAGQLRENTVASLGIQAQIAGEKDNIVLARGLVDQMVTAKFGQQEADLKAKLANIDLLSKDPTLTAEQQDRANYQALKLKAEQNKLDQQKEDSTTIASWAIAMGKYQGDATHPAPTQLEIDNIMRLAKSDDPQALQKALTIYSKYSANPQDLAKQANDLQIQRLTIDEKTAANALAAAKNPIDIAQAKANLEKTRTEINNLKVANEPIVPGTARYKVAQDLAYGNLTMNQFRTLYSYSRDINQKLAIYQLASQLNPNFNPAAFEAGYTFANNPKVRQQVASLDNVQNVLPEMLSASDQATRTGTGLNGLVIKGGIAIGNSNYSNFMTARTAFADELSGALGYGSATDMSREMGFNMADPNLSAQQFKDGLVNIVQPFIASKRSTLINQMGQYGNMVNNFSSSGNTDISSRASSAGYNYQAMKAAGYSDADIDAALKALGK